jgi:hypothetical protein
MEDKRTKGIDKQDRLAAKRIADLENKTKMNLLNLSMSIGTGKKFESSKIKSLAKSQSHDSKKNEDSESPRLSDSQSLTQKN